MKLIEKIGFYGIELIEEQIEKGIDIDGKPYHYSTRPFKMPVSNKLVGFKKLQKEGRLKVYTSNKTGKLWQVVMGGYRDWRILNKREPDKDFLQWSGAMLRSLSSRAESDTRSVIYFISPEQSQKAYWFNISGVGKSRKLWKFLGWTEANKKRLAEYAASLVPNDPEFVKKIMEQIKIQWGL